MSQPVICCYYKPTEKLLIGSGNHNPLLEANGYSTKPEDIDKWLFGELILDRNPIEINIPDSGMQKISEDDRFRIEDILFKCAGDADSLVRHVKKYGFHSNLINILIGKEKQRMSIMLKSRENAILETDLKGTERSEFVETIMAELRDAWIEMFFIIGNRTIMWREL